MAGTIMEIVILVMYAIGINMLLVGFANAGINLGCSNLNAVYNSTYNATAVSYGHTTIIDLAMNRCSGLPSWIVYVFNFPILLGLLYIIRAFIGAT